MVETRLAVATQYTSSQSSLMSGRRLIAVRSPSALAAVHWGVETPRTHRNFLSQGQPPSPEGELRRSSSTVPDGHLHGRAIALHDAMFKKA
jgi:hypothetical protein